jgi:hypothetical protein
MPRPPAPACGVVSGCRGTLKLGYYHFRNHKRNFLVPSDASYDLRDGESVRVPLSFSRKTAANLSKRKRTYLIAIANGEEGQQAKRGLALQGQDRKSLVGLSVLGLDDADGE